MTKQETAQQASQPQTEGSPEAAPEVSKSKPRYFTTKRITYLAIFSALSSVLYLLPKIMLPIFPSFLEFQFSDIPALIAGYMLGPVAGIIVLVIKTLTKLPFTGTSGVGELCDLILGLIFVLSSALIYQKGKTTRSAVAGLAIGSVLVIGGAVLVNRFISVPFYAYIMFREQGGLAFIVNIVSGLYAGVTIDNFYAYYLPLAVVPFNLIRTVISAMLSYLLYWGLKNADRRLFPEKKKQKDADSSVS